jgi:hypothetical protein
MKLNRHARMFGLLVASAALAACAQSRVQQPTANESASPAVYSADQVASLERYAARMEELYASQEAEILRLRQELASLRSRSQ